MAKILIVDDDDFLRDMLTRHLTYMNHNVITATNCRECLKHIESSVLDLVILDVRLPDGSGLDLVGRIRSSGEVSPEVIIITGEGDADGAEMAISSGAWDYIQKPVSPGNMTLPIKRALQHQQEKSRGRTFNIDACGLVGTGISSRETMERIEVAASCEASVLVMGETGTGKELVARAVHSNSSRRDHRFVVVDCAALPSTLAESILFGHVRGAYTGADKSSEGLVTLSDKGTLFLDEIGELSLELQKKFLRVLQERKYRSVGGKGEVSSDFRLISATNRNLELMVEEGTFRRDLLHRLRTIQIDLRPLRERMEDLETLVEHYCREFGKRYEHEIRPSNDFIQALKDHTWPGNIRELVNVIEEAVVLAGEDNDLIPQHLPARVRIGAMRRSFELNKSQEGDTAQSSQWQESTESESADTIFAQTEPRLKTSARISRKEWAPSSGFPSFKEFREGVIQEAESQYIHDLVREARGDINLACRIADLGRSRLYSLMKKHDVSRFGWTS
ncbi:MAG: Fis family transcriptional regulator [Candidatus Wallbacteria bacterium HGW-Wallbacteria-1]|jgi:two-component system NtrC family response regulator|uniref:Fis family transcriptional regulator n=1 Tax=Candidatus Wallbacteria bacterium HGW-Wallbacteria-1 TaxID=2013854 RepID=A0A2N1PS93_9BACT|nr:MAG: Fis family transcriptional regulator [Candidatus Wallbacteria bacterium HGW-Wallbacteria-1]